MKWINQYKKFKDIFHVNTKYGTIIMSFVWLHDSGQRSDKKFLSRMRVGCFIVRRTSTRRFLSSFPSCNSYTHLCHSRTRRLAFYPHGNRQPWRCWRTGCQSSSPSPSHDPGHVCWPSSDTIETWSNWCHQVRTPTFNRKDGNLANFWQ